MANSVNQADQKVTVKGEKPTKTLVYRDFGGMNTQSPRESIRDEQFYWIENAQPIGPGNMPTLYNPAGPIGSFASGTWSAATPLYTATASYGGNDYIYALFANEGFFQMNVVTGVPVQIASAGKFTSAMQITQWNNGGILIVDPVAGYFDWNITASNTLTNITQGASGTGTVGSVTITAGGTGWTSTPTLTFSGGSPTTPAAGYATLGITGGTIVFGGGGTIVHSVPPQVIGYRYAIGDILTVLGGSYTQPAQLQVTGINITTGAILGISLLTAGSYSSFSTTAVPVSPGNATFNLDWALVGGVVTNPGVGYTSAPSVTFTGGGGSGGSGTATLGSTAGQIGSSIATYAGRVWIANGRNVSYTDVGSYNSFGGAGGAFTITDSTLHLNITALFPANGYLFIFGDDSVDILSNVQVQTTGGISTTTFSRVNLTTSVGTNFPTSVFPYLRSILFANDTGFYALAGSSPEKISNDLDGLLPYIDFSRPVYGSPMEMNGILCASFSFFFNDFFTSLYYGQYRPVIAFFFQGKWFLTSQSANSNSFVGIPVNGVYTGYLVENTGAVWPCFNSTNPAQTIIQTKLWDDGEPIMDKQVLRVGIGGVFQNNTPVTMTTDTEYGTYPITLDPDGISQVNWINNNQQIVLWENNTPILVAWSKISYPSYQFLVGTANAAGGKYCGITLTLQTPMTLASIAMEYKMGARW